MFDTPYLRRRPLITLWAFLLAGPASAQDPDAGPRPPLVVTGEFLPDFTPPPRIEFMQARRLADGGRLSEAAAMLEALAGEMNDLRLLYHAAIARSRAGQHTHALRHFTAVRALAGLGDAARAELDAKIAAESALLVAVHLDVREPIPSHPAVALGPGTRITAEAAGLPAIALDPASARLDPGAWIVHIDVPGYVPLTVTRQVTPGPTNSWQLFLTRRIVAQELRFAPPGALRRVQLRLIPQDRTDLQPIQRPLSTPTTTVQLTTGTWQLLATSPRYQATANLVVGPDPRPVDILLARRTAADQPRFIKERKLILGVAVALGVAFYAGIGVTLVGTNREGKARDRNNALLADAGVEPDAEPDAAQLAEVEAAYPTADLHADLRRSTNLVVAGPTIMAGGLGMIVGVMPSLFEARRRAAYILLGTGAAATVGGSVWMHDYVRRREQILGPTDPAHRVDSVGLTGHRLGAIMITGIGVGMTVGSALLLITDHARRRRTRSISAAPTPGGLLIRGNF